MKMLKSSWNPDRVAAACCNHRPSKGGAPRVAALYAQYKAGSDCVSVFTRRGRKIFARRFGDEILSACVFGDQLRVETRNGGSFACDAWTGKLLESEVPSQAKEAWAGNAACATSPSTGFVVDSWVNSFMIN